MSYLSPDDLFARFLPAGAPVFLIRRSGNALRSGLTRTPIQPPTTIRPLGGFDAFIDAIRQVLPAGFDFPSLLDYELRIPRGGSTGALTEVFIT